MRGGHRDVIVLYTWLGERDFQVVWVPGNPNVEIQVAEVGCPEEMCLSSFYFRHNLFFLISFIHLSRARKTPENVIFGHFLNPLKFFWCFAPGFFVSLGGGGS